MTLPLTWFLRCNLPDHLVQPLLECQMLVAVAPDGPDHDAGLFAQWERDLATGDAATLRATQLEIQARLLRLSLERADGARTAGAGSRKSTLGLGDGGLAKVEQMACMIAQHYTSPITVDAVAQAVKLHPKYAMGLFHKVFGKSLSSYVTQHRITHAQRLLATTGMRVLDIAEASGFSSLSRFNSTFRRTCGCSPREYRQGHARRTD